MSKATTLPEHPRSSRDRQCSYAPHPLKGGAGQEQSNRKDQTMPIPTITPTTIHPNKHTRIVTITCPYCGNAHTHGWPHDTLDTPGHRIAHCGQGSYRITYPTNYDETTALDQWLTHLNIPHIATAAQSEGGLPFRAGSENGGDVRDNSATTATKPQFGRVAS